MKKTFYLIIIALLALSFDNISFADEAKEAQTDAPKVEKKEPVFNASVPEDGSVEDYFAFIKNVRTQKNLMAKPVPTNQGEYFARLVTIFKACNAAADKILAKDSLTQEQRVDAVKVKAGSVEQLEEFDGRYQNEFPAVIKLCKENGLDEIAERLQEKLDVQKFVDDFMTARGAGETDKEKNILNEVIEKAEQKGKKLSYVYADGLGFILEFSKEIYDKDQDNALKAKVMDIFGNADDRRVAMLAGGIRRESLPGNEMLVGGKFIDDTEYKAEDYAGKTVLIDFWATWCGPCRGEIPNVKKLYAFYHDKGFEIIGISSDRDVETLKNFTEKEGMSWKQMMRNDAVVADGQTMGVYYGVTGIPTMILIGPDGKVITVNARGQNLGKALEDIYGPMPKEEKKDNDDEE